MGKKHTLIDARAKFLMVLWRFCTWDGWVLLFGSGG